jgi:hypothetical protein
MRITSRKGALIPWVCALVTAATVTAVVSVASAQAPDAPPPTSEAGQEILPPQPPPPPAPRAAPEIAVPPALLGQQVVVKTEDATIKGTLVAIYEDEIVIEKYDRQRISVDRATIVVVRDREPDPPVAEEAAVTPRKAPSHWGIWGGLSAGPAWGGRKGPIEPSAVFGADLGVSFHFVYVGAGLGFTSFKSVDSFSQDTTDGVPPLGAPITVTGYLEAGLTQGIFISYSPTEAIELRPGVGYGYELMGSTKQSVFDCIACGSRSYDYSAGQYLRFQLGVYYSVHPRGSKHHRVLMTGNGIFVGGTVSVQHFVFRSDPQIQDALLFGVTAGFGP